ncbi:MAG: hypothetical protein N2712_01960 [Brevinematales bacterium]|nr:hypothetical protein [Brevinematales bacterium]
MKLRAVIITLIFAVIFGVLGVLLYFTLVFDPNALISNLLTVLEDTYKLQVKFKLKQKNFLSIISGVELNEVEIYSKHTTTKKLIGRSDKVLIHFNILDVLETQQIREITVIRSSVNVKNLLDYITSDTFKSSISNSGSQQGFSVELLNLQDMVASYEKIKLSFSWSRVYLDNLRVEGFLSTTKTKFSFDGTNFVVDNFEGGNVLGDIKLKRFVGKITNSSIEGVISSLSYSNFLSITNLSLLGDLQKLRFEGVAENVKLLLSGLDMSFTNTKLHLMIDKSTKITFSTGQVDGIITITENGIFGNVDVKNLSTNNLHKDILDSLKTTIDNIDIKGNLKFHATEDNLNIGGRFRGEIATKVNYSILKRINLDIEIEDNELTIRVNLKTQKTDVEMLGNLDRKLNLNSVTVTSKRLYLEDFQDVGKNNSEKVSLTSLPTNIPFLLSNTTLLIEIEELISDTTPFKINNLSISGKATFDKGILKSDFSVNRIRILNLNTSGRGSVTISTNFLLTISFHTIPFELASLYTLIGTPLGGRVYGRGVIDKFSISFDRDLSVKAQVEVTNIEMVDLKIQNEIARLLNLNLKHLFIDRISMHLEITNQTTIARGVVEGDISSSFSATYMIPKEKINLKFDYLKVDRSVIEDIPKILFLRNEINGIRYTIEGNSLSFKSFEINL